MNNRLIAYTQDGNFQCIKILVAYGADVTARNGQGQTALDIAAHKGDINCLNALIEAKSDLNACDTEGCTALHIAAKSGHLECLKSLIEAGARVDAYDKEGKTALHMAAQNGHLDCVQALIGAKADVNAHGVLSSSLQHVRSLREANEDFNIHSLRGTTPLHEASRYGHTECVRALIKAKADVNMLDKLGDTALLWAAQGPQGPHVDCVKALIEAKADVNVHYGHFTALYWSAMLGSIDCVKVLLQAKADFGPDNEYFSPFWGAAVNNGCECVKELAKYSYLFVPSDGVVLASRKRIFNVLLQFVKMRKVHPELTNLKGESLQFEILSRNKLLQEDLVIILLDELKKGREIKGVALIRSKDAAIDYLLKKIEENLSRIDISRSTPAMRVLLDRTKIEENFGALVREGFNRRFDELKVR